MRHIRFVFVNWCFLYRCLKIVYRNKQLFLTSPSTFIEEFQTTHQWVSLKEFYNVWWVYIDYYKGIGQQTILQRRHMSTTTSFCHHYDCLQMLRLVTTHQFHHILVRIYSSIVLHEHEIEKDQLIGLKSYK